MAGEISAHHAARRDGVRAGQLLRSRRDLALETGALGIAAEARRSGNILGADRTGHEAGVPHKDVTRSLPDRARAQIEHLARIEESLEQRSSKEQATPV